LLQIFLPHLIPEMLGQTAHQLKKSEIKLIVDLVGLLVLLKQ
jgi:hypothetical protein